MDVCVVLVVRTVAWNVNWHEGRKDLNSKKWINGGEKKSRRGHGCLCCVCCKDGNMERKVTWRTKGFKQYRNGSKGENSWQAKKNPTGGMDVCLLWVLCVVR
jgi:hypothetical protein